MDLLNSQGRALTYIANHPQCTIRGIADGVPLTYGRVWGLVNGLHKAGLICVTKGQAHRYAVPDLLLRQTLFALAKYERSLPVYYVTPK